jgi:putative peptidoglycan lipid II flippase
MAMSTGTEEVEQNVAAQGGVVAGMTLLSRISGLLRDMVLSYFLGAQGVADAFFVAFRIPNFFRRLFAEGAFNQAFVPVLARYRAGGSGGSGSSGSSGSIEELKTFVATIEGNLALALLPVVVIGVLFAPALIMVFAPGFWDDDVRFGLASDMVRITFPYLGFISLTAFAGAVLNSHHRYAIPAFTPVLLNLSLIGAMLFAADLFATPVYALAWGVFVAGIVQLLFQGPALQRLGLLIAPRVSRTHPGARQVGTLLLPAIFAASASQINALIDTMLASTLITGSISWLYYSDRLLELPIGLVAVALGTVLLPNLSRLDAAGAREQFSETLDWGMRMGVVLGVPAAAALYALATPLIATIFLRGELTPLDAAMTALSLQAFAVGLPALVLVKVLAPAYFARQDTATPFRFAAIAIGTNIALNLALFFWMGHVGLALATSAAGWVNAMLLLRGILNEDRYHPGRRLLLTSGRAVAASIIMVLALYWCVPTSDRWMLAGDLQRSGWLALTVVGGAGVYLLCLIVMGERLRNLLHRV